MNEQNANLPAPPKQEPEIIDLTKALVIRQKDGGEIRQFKTKMVLSTIEDTLVALPGTGTMIVSATGYNLMARTGGMIVVNANTVVVDGVNQANPHVKRNARGHIEQVTCRALCFGYSPIGIPTVSDRTVTFDLGLYRIQDLIAKAKNAPAAFKLVPAGTEVPGPSWARYSLDEAVDMLVDTASQEAINWYSNINSRQKKAVEYAQTFAQRNAIKAHPNVTLHKCKTPTASLTMSVWRPVKGSMQWDMTGFAGQVDLIEQIADGKRTSAAADTVAVTKGTDNLNEDPTVNHDIRVVEPEEADPNGPPESQPPSATPPKGEFADPNGPIAKDLERWMKEEPALFATVTKECGTSDEIWWTEEAHVQAKVHQEMTKAMLAAQNGKAESKKRGAK